MTSMYFHYFCISSTELGVSCALYHAGLSLAVRKKAHMDFVNDDVQVKKIPSCSRQEYNSSSGSNDKGLKVGFT